MKTLQIAALLQPFAELSEKQLADTLMYINLILKWNARINLTAVRSPEQIVTRHFGESFFVAGRLFADEPSQSAIDLGSGAGFPGLPMAIFVPDARVTLIESNGKKAAFLNEVIRAVGLSNAKVFGGRGEEYPGTARLVVMRAVEKFEAAVRLAARLLEPGGRLALMIGQGQVPKAVALVSDLRWRSPIEIPGGHSRVLLTGIKAINVE